MSNCYTFIMGFRGGKYISQIHASDERSAMFEWANSLDIEKIEGMKEADKVDLLKKIADELPIRIHGCENVWSFLIHAKGKSCDVDFVMTQPSSNCHLLT